MAIETPDWIIEMGARAAFEVAVTAELTAFGKEDEDRSEEQVWATADPAMKQSFMELSWAVIVDGLDDSEWYRRDTQNVRQNFDAKGLRALEAEYALHTQAARKAGLLLNTLRDGAIHYGKAHPEKQTAPWKPAAPVDHVVQPQEPREVSDEVLNLASRAAFESQVVTGADAQLLQDRPTTHTWEGCGESERRDMTQIAWDVLVDRFDNEASFQRWLAKGGESQDSPWLIQRYRTNHYLACDTARQVGETLLAMNDRAAHERDSKHATPAPPHGSADVR